MDRSGYLVLTTVSLAAVGAYLPLFLLGALAVQIQGDLGFGPSIQGMLFGLFNATVAIAAIPLAIIPDRIGWRRTTRLAALTAAVAMAVVATFAQDWISLALITIVAAAANSLVIPSGNIAIVTAVPVARRGFAFGTRHAAVPLSALLGGAAVPLVAVPYGWRPVYLVAALVPVCAAVLASGVRRQPAPVTQRRGPIRPRMSAGLALLLAVSAIGATIVNTSNAFLVNTAVAGGISPAVAGTLLILGSAVALTLRVAIGLLIDRLEMRGFGMIAALLAVSMLGFALIATGTTGGIVAGTALGLGAGTGWPGVLHYVITREHREHAGGVSSLLLTTASLGGIVGPVVFGIVVEQFGYGSSWMFLSGAAGLGVILILMSGRAFATRSVTEKSA